MKTAKLVKSHLTGFNGNASLYELSEPLTYGYDDEKETRHIIVSASGLAYETYIFPATADGDVADWGELKGSYRGGSDHARAIEGAGFTVEGVAS